jgi:lysophospholipase L1-like esterase
MPLMLSLLDRLGPMACAASRIASAAAVLAGFAALPAMAQGQAEVQAEVQAEAQVAETCLKAASGLSLGAPLPRLKARLAAGLPALIVAIGSSSTRGVGASGWPQTYPEVMQRELQRLRGRARIEIANLGSNGETISGQVARMERDALALRPALVIWQLGSNDVVWPWGGIGPGTEAEVVETISRIKASGSDVILMDLQNAPLVAGARLRPAMLDLTARAARAGGAGHFQRFRLLERTVAAGVPLSALTSWDQLHNTDAAYDCTGRAIARAIHAAAR